MSWITKLTSVFMCVALDFGQFGKYASELEDHTCKQKKYKDTRHCT